MPSSDSSPSPAAARAPGYGLKLMLIILLSFALVAAYGQWQRAHRSKIESITILPELAPSPKVSPNERKN